MKRQGLIITIGQLIKLNNDLIKEEIEFQKELGFENDPIDYGKEFQINIINKEGLSDTWKIENYNQQKKDKDDGSNVSLSGDTNFPQGKNNKDEQMLVERDNHADIDDLRNPVLDAVTPLDGRRNGNL